MTSREQFEVWWFETQSSTIRARDREGESYNDPYLHFGWKCWQGSRKLGMEAAAAVVQALADNKPKTYDFQRAFAEGLVAAAEAIRKLAGEQP